MDEMKRRQYLVKDALRPVKGVTFHYHDDDVSEMEAIFARGDRKLADVLVKAHELGCMFDGWTEHFRYDLWCQALEACGIDKREYLDGQPLDKELCWEFIDCGVTRRYLLAERDKAHQAVATVSCNKGCRGCGCQSIVDCNRKEGKA